MINSEILDLCTETHLLSILSLDILSSMGLCYVYLEAVLGSLLLLHILILHGFSNITGYSKVHMNSMRKLKLVIKESQEVGKWLLFSTTALV